MKYATTTKDEYRFYVSGAGLWENDEGPKGWHAVTDDEAGGIIAYFGSESHAVAFNELLRVLVDKNEVHDWQGWIDGVSELLNEGAPTQYAG